MTATRLNIAANIAGRIWGVVAYYLFVPFYLKRLGPEAYGVVGFFGVLLGVLVIVDLGLTSTMSREMARLGATREDGAERRDLARTLEILYLAAALLMGALVFFGAPLFADRWLQARTLPRGVLIEALRIMGLAIAFQLPASFYFGGLLGLERLVLANALQIAWGFVRSGGAVLALWLLAPTLQVFFVTVAGANLIFLIVFREACWRSIGPGAPPRFRGALLARTWRYSAGIAGMAVLSTLLTQLDKLVVSRLLPLDTFAHYSLAAMLSQSPAIVAVAIATALFPRLTALAAKGHTEDLRRLYHDGCQLVCVVSLPMGLTLAAYAPEVLRFWTHSPDTAAAAGLAAALLSIGSTMLAIQFVPYQLALAFGWVGLNLRIAAVSLVVMAPALWWLVSRFGVVGAASTWLALNVGTTIAMIPWLHRRLLPGATRVWLLSDVARPLLATLAVLGAARWLAPRPAAPFPAFLTAVVVGVIALVAASLASPAIRSRIHLRRPVPVAP
jgi:O-antigen/teichoic acid export membrane protein